MRVALIAASTAEDTEAWLRRVAETLLVAIPVLIVLGPAPADVAVSIIGVLFLVQSALSGHWAWLRTPWVAWAMALWVYLIATMPLADEPTLGASRALPFGRFIIFGAALQHWLLTSWRTQRLLLAVLGAVASFVVLDCLIQFFAGQDLFGRPYEEMRLSGPFADNVPGSFLSRVSLPVVGLGFALAAGAAGRRWWLAVVAMLTVLLAITILLTGERMSFFVFGLGLGVFFLMTPSLRRPLLVTGLVGAVLAAAALLVERDLGDRFVDQTVEDVDDFWNDRYGEIFARSVRLWREAPVFGLGLEHFQRECENDGILDKSGPVEHWCFAHPHNVYLEWLVEAGGIGFLGFLGLVALWARELIRGMRAGEVTPVMAGACAAVVVFLWPLRSSMSFFSTWNAVLLWLMLGLALALLAPRSPGDRVRSPS